MNIYLVSRTDEVDWDEYISIVVVAESSVEAKRIYPSEHSEQYWNKNNLSAKLIGEAREGVERGVVLTQFNAG